LQDLQDLIPTLVRSESIGGGSLARTRLLQESVVDDRCRDLGLGDRREGGRVTGFETSVRISCPIDEVFAFVAEPLNFPRWNSAVRAVRHTGGEAGAVGSTYAMERDLPSGRAQNELEVFARGRPTEFGIRTTSGPTPFSYRYGFTAANGETVVRLDAAVELEGPAALLGPLAGRAVKRGVDSNFAELKRILEASVPPA
jgi:Polyketide cyclase / dehydrase and lipid transport